jgi:hypothetical protein
MKTQLLQDFQESGSAPAAPASTPPPAPPAPPVPPPRRPAVWHGPGSQRAEAGAAAQRADPGPMQRAPEVSARGKGVAIEALADRIAQQRTARPAPPPPGADATLPGNDARQPPEPPRPPEPPPQPDHIPPPRAEAGPGTIPRPVEPDIEAEWLAARLREEAAARAAPAWSSLWKRRLVTWSIAGGLLAGLAAGGLWLYEENRVEDALVVVANTSPAGPPPPVQAFAAGAPAPASAPVQPAVAPEAVKPLPEPAPEPALEPAVVDDKPPAPVDVSPPRRTPRARTAAKKRSTAKVRRAAVPEAPPPAANPSPRDRREETLMQCRAHGYDARQCIERACTMTRYGLACKG